MKVRFYQSLDRPVEIFGVKGKWITVFICMSVGFILLGVMVGAVMGTGIGIFIAIMGLFVSFAVALFSQGSVPHRRLRRFVTSSSMRFSVTRRETLCHLYYRSDHRTWFGAKAAELEKLNSIDNNKEEEK